MFLSYRLKLSMKFWSSLANKCILYTKINSVSLQAEGIYIKNRLVKLIKLIATSFLPRAVGGAATRLKIFLEEADTQGFKDPPGMLQAGFWGSKVNFLFLKSF